MSNIGKVTGAFLSASQETTFALVNANIDFSLVRFESPEEYRGLGGALSADRRKTAEDGPFHVTARRLGALFDEVLPHAPNLIRAYGTRASSIAGNPVVNPRGTQDHGFFKDHIGADGTSIWAAATSSTAAIGVHMLACMIARFWKSTESIAIWVEMIETRKKQLAERASREPSNLSALWAARISVSRQDVGSWDASARAWLETADNAMRKQHTQLMLIAQNISLTVNAKMTTYDGVIGAVKVAMTTVDRLIDGMPQSPQDGAALLGLSAWHVFPDMLVLGGKTVEVQQHDELVGHGGRLTLGLHFGPDCVRDGLHWSLPLAHLRYYGDPVRSERAITDVGSRIPFSHFRLVILGASLNAWGLKNHSDAIRCQFVRLLWHLMRSVHNRSIFPWLATLGRAAEAFETATEPEMTVFCQLISFGHRRASSFLSQSAVPLLAMSATRSILEGLEGRESQIAFLRIIAGISNNSREYSLVIRFKIKPSDMPPGFCLCRCHSEGFAYATASPRLLQRETSNGDLEDELLHIRWAPSINVKRSYLNPCRCEIGAGEACCHPNLPENMHPEKAFPCTWVAQTENQLCDSLSVSGEYFVQLLSPETVRFRGPRHQKCRDPLLQELERDQLLHRLISTGLDYGDDIGLYVLADSRVSIRDPSLIDYQLFNPPDEMEGASKPYLEELAAFLHSNEISQDALQDTLETGSAHGRSRFAENQTGFSALAAADQIYQNFPRATIPLGVCKNSSIYESQWARSFERLYQKNRIMSRTEAFACITFFESGGIDLAPAVFEHVMAVCSGNSLFVSGALLRDPWELQDSSTIQQLIGNVGRPGIALLVPPTSPRVRQPELEKWRHINHFVFKGPRENAFNSTSLHLSFTDAEVPLMAGQYGDRSAEVSFVESLVSVHDRGQWVADLNIPGDLNPSNPVFLLRLRECQHVEQDYDGRKLRLQTIENWEEYLDPPNGLAIFQTHGNWSARLASAAMIAQRKDLAIVLPKAICWACIQDNVELARRLAGPPKIRGGLGTPNVDLRSARPVAPGSDIVMFNTEIPQSKETAEYGENGEASSYQASDQDPRIFLLA